MDFKELHKNAYNRILSASNVLVISHINPDGDAMSSVGAMAELLHGLGKPYKVFCENKHGQFLGIPHEEEIISIKEEVGTLSEFDLFIILDCGAMSRTALTTEIQDFSDSSRPYIIEFDHHPRLDDYADIEIRRPEKASTTEVLYNFLVDNEIEINKDMARCLLTGILTDTANFLYPNTSSETISIASVLLGKGAQFSKIISSISNNKTMTTLKLWGRAMEKLVVNKKFNMAVCVLSETDIKESTGGEEIDSDVFSDISGFLSNVGGVDSLIMIREENGKIKGSLRGMSAASDISELARLLGGGGHPKASGFLIDGSLEEVLSV